MCSCPHRPRTHAKRHSFHGRNPFGCCLIQSPLFTHHSFLTAPSSWTQHDWRFRTHTRQPGPRQRAMYRLARGPYQQHQPESKWPWGIRMGKMDYAAWGTATLSASCNFKKKAFVSRAIRDFFFFKQNGIREKHKDVAQNAHVTCCWGRGMKNNTRRKNTKTTHKGRAEINRPQMHDICTLCSVVYE